MSLKQGTVLGDRYRIGSVLGAGGMGTVHRATHVALDQPVAIKVMTGTTMSKSAVGRFMREAKLAAKLRSEHVVHVLDFATTAAGTPYIVLEFLEGTDLAELLDRRGPIEVETAVDWLLQALVGLAEAHALGIVHRDLKPGNLFLSTLPDGEKVIKVMDFGLSKSVIPDDEASAITHTQALMGTPAYSAPEMLRSARKANAASDLFAMGVVLYQLLTTRTPWEAPTIPELVSAVLGGNPTPPRAHVPAIPALLEGVILRCLEADPSHRFADVGELALALAPFAPRPAIAKRVVRMLGGDIASARLEASIQANDKTLHADEPPPRVASPPTTPIPRVAPLGDPTVPNSVEPVGISTRVIESPSARHGAPASARSGGASGGLVGTVVGFAAIAVAVVSLAIFVALPKLSSARTKSLIATATASESPPRTEPATLAPPAGTAPAPASAAPASAPTLAETAPTPVTPPAPAPEESAPVRRTASAPVAPRRTPASPSAPPAVGTSGFGGRY